MRLETQTLIQTTGQTGAERLATLMREHERLGGMTQSELRELRVVAGELRDLLALHDRRLRDLEKEALRRGATGISDPGMAAVVVAPPGRSGGRVPSQLGRGDPRRDP